MVPMLYAANQAAETAQQAIELAENHIPQSSWSSKGQLISRGLTVCMMLDDQWPPCAAHCKAGEYNNIQSNHSVFSCESAIPIVYSKA